MPLYEHVFLARQDLAQAHVDALAENATKIITDNGATTARAIALPVKRRSNNGPRILPAPQVLPLLGQGRAKDRLQGRAPAPGLRFRARQDRAVAHHRRVIQEAA